MIAPRPWLKASEAWREAVLGTCEMFGVTEDQLLSRARPESLCLARAHCYALLRLCGWSYPDIGSAFGRDHVVIMRAVQTAKWEAEREQAEWAMFDNS